MKKKLILFLMLCSMASPLRGNDFECSRCAGEGYYCSRRTSVILIGIAIGAAVIGGMIAVVISDSNHGHNCDD